MQATIGQTTFQLTTGRMMLVATVGLVASLVLGAGALAMTDHLPGSGGHTPGRSAVKAYANVGQGEGLLGPALTVAAPHLATVANPYAGEGRTNVLRATASQVVAHYAPYMGEGRLTVRRLLTSPSMVTGCGQGEGLLQHAIPVANPCQ